MKKRLTAGILSLSIMTTAWAQTGTANPLLQNWTGPYGGIPPFDKVQIVHFKPAMEAAMAAQLAEVEKIAANPQAPTFDNTLAAMEAAGKTLSRVQTVYGIWSSTMNSKDFQAVEKELAPKLAAHQDKITQN
ncbi:MAG: M3 family peptidase, partial [Chitinophagaceae bacterium]